MDDIKKKITSTIRKDNSIKLKLFNLVEKSRIVITHAISMYLKFTNQYLGGLEPSDLPSP